MDNWLFQHYKHIGGEAYDGDGIYNIDFDRRIAKLSSGREIEYDFLVAADGANSRVKQLLAKSKSNFKAYLPNGITFEVLVDRNDLPNVEGINLHFNITKEAYSWVFGKGDKICIGLGQYLSNSSDGRIVLKDFMKKLGVKNIDKYPIRGAMLPYNLFDQKPIWNQQVLLVGDSACLVEPFTGEGIFYAAQSGIFAAESIFTCIHCEKCNIEKLYLSKLKPIYRILKDGIYYFKLFNNDWISKSFRRKANNRKDFLAYFYDIRIDKGRCLPFWLIALRYKIGKFFNRLKKKLKKS